MSCVICGRWKCLTHVGYNGQRYEVRFSDGTPQERVMGWTDDPTGGGLVKSIKLHPVWTNPRVVDLRPDPPKQKDQEGAG